MWHDPFGWFFESVIGIVGFVLVIFLYFLPTYVALIRHHRNALASFLVKLFLGGTGVGWLVALIWAFVG